MATGLTTVSAANLRDATGTKIANATIWFQPVLSNGQATSFAAGGDARGAVASVPVSAVVTDGAFTIQLFDTSLTTPQYIGYAVTVVDNATADQLLGPGYGCIQPSGATWSLDTYAPNLGPAVSQVVGPAGPAGPAGPPGAGGLASGTVLLNGSGVPFTLGVTGGELSITPTAPVLIDTVTAQLWQVGLAAGADGITRPTFTLVPSAAFPAASVEFYDMVALRTRTLTIASGHYVIT